MACKEHRRTPWPPNAPISMDTAAAILQELYLRRSALNAEGLLSPTHDTLWHNYTRSTLDKYHLSPATWESLRKLLKQHPDAMVALAETTLARLGN